MHGNEASIELQMSLLLCVALAGYLVAIRINQSAVVGAILVGIAIGPSGLGWITYSTFVANIAHLGAIILLFVIGLEFKLKDITQWRYLWIALGGVILPWFGGWGLAKLFGFSSIAALYVGTALTATSIAITANVLQELGQLRSTVAQAIIGAAVIDDILSLLALSLTEQIGAASLSWGSTLLLGVKAVAFIAIGGLLGQRTLGPLLEKIDRSTLAERYPEFVFVCTMLIAFTYALLAEMVGLSAIVGAFLAGVALEGVGLRRSHQFREGADYLRVIFASIFFVSLGVLVDLRQLQWETAWFITLLILVAIGTKLLGCGLIARLVGLNARESWAVGFGMAPRGEVAMIIALLGLKQELIGQPTYVSLVIMALVTTLVVPPVLRVLLLPAGTQPPRQPITDKQDPTH